MVFVYLSKNSSDKLMFIKAEQSKDVEDKVRLKEDYRLVAALTSNDVGVLNSAHFAVIEA